MIGSGLIMIIRDSAKKGKSAYAIGKAEPLEQTVIIDGQPEEIKGYNLTPKGIIEFLNLRRPIYEETAKYGHYGHNFDWDK